MKIKPKNARKYQMGGEMAPALAPELMPEQGAELMPAEGGNDPLMMLAEGAAQALQSQDCLMALQVCQGLISLLQQMAGGAPAQDLGEPVFRKGGILLGRIRR